MNLDNDTREQPQITQANIDANKFNLDLGVRWVQFADSKANFLLTISLALFGVSFAIIPEATRIVLLIANCECWRWLVVIILLLFLLYLIFGLLGISKLIRVVAPRLIPRTASRYLFFFATIAEMEIGNFIKEMLSLQPKRTASELAGQTHECAVVASEKYADIRAALKRLCVAFVAGLIFVVLIGILSGIFPKPNS